MSSFVVVTNYHIVSHHVMSFLKSGLVQVFTSYCRIMDFERWEMHGDHRQLTISAKAHLTPQSKTKKGDWEASHFSAFWSTLTFYWPGCKSHELHSFILLLVLRAFEPNVVQCCPNICFAWPLACRSQLHDEHMRTKISSFQKKFEKI